MWESALSIRGAAGAFVAGAMFAAGWVIMTNALQLLASLMK